MRAAAKVMANTEYGPAIVAAAKSHLNETEWPGAKSNPVVEMHFARAGHPGVKDDVPWCAAFVGSILAEVGLPNTGSLMARSYVKWGTEVFHREARPGDVIVFKRGNPPQGHVAFFLSWNGSHVHVIGGNQGDKVSEHDYPVEDILAIRRADGATRPGVSRVTLRKGDTGEMVKQLQSQLATLGHFVGKVDGDFGTRTQAGVLAFQAGAGLETDGVVGPVTWDALKKASPPPLRAVDKQYLRAKGSRTIASADGIDITTSIAGVTATATAVKDAADQATGTLDTVKNLIVDQWPLLLVGVLLLAIFVFTRNIKKYRVEDAQTGANSAL